MQQFVIILIVLLGLTNISSLYWGLKHAAKHPELDSPSFEWINPQLKYERKPVISKAAYESFRGELLKAIEKDKTAGRISDVAVFFRDLSSGPAFGINTNDKFIPASLLKVPLALTYFKLSEDDPSLLSREFAAKYFTLNLIQEFPPAEVIEVGKAYKVEDLIRRLLVYSDNHALEILQDNLYKASPNEDLLLQTYKETGIIDAYSDDVSEETLSVKAYSSIFRQLYNASYLSKELSDKMLQIMTMSKFESGLRGGVPEAVPVAHKFGEYFVNNKYELHDCGIIYYPQNPYLLCVMTKGNNFDDLADVIAEISKAVYEEIDARRLR